MKKRNFLPIFALNLIFCITLTFCIFTTPIYPQSVLPCNAQNYTKVAGQNIIAVGQNIIPVGQNRATAISQNADEQNRAAVVLKSGTAAQKYSRILDENTVFYADPGCTIAKFVLPYGYFVKVLSVGENSIAVRYMDESANLPARDGFILVKCYYPCDYDCADSPYPNCDFKLSADEVLFADSGATTPKAVLAAGKTCHFYGNLEINGEQFYCVYSNGYIGYVRARAFADAAVPPHPLPIKSQTDSSPTDSASAPTDELPPKQTTPYATGTDSALKTVIVLAVSLVALSVVYLLFKPSRKHRYAFTDKDSDDLL